MSEERNYFSIIPYDVRHDKDLPANVKLLYGDIASLTHKDGYCYASNSFLAEEFDVTPQAISKWVNMLKDKGYIRVEMLYNGTEVKQRKIYLLGNIYKAKGDSSNSEVSTKDEKGINKGLKGYQQKIKGNNINLIINTNNKISSDKPSSEPPKFSDFNTETKKKSSRSKKVTVSAEEKHKQNLASLSSEELQMSEKCSDFLIQIRTPLSPTHNPADNKLAWQDDFVQISKSLNISLNEIYEYLTVVQNISFLRKLITCPKKFKEHFDRVYAEKVDCNSTLKTKYQSNKKVGSQVVDCGNQNYEEVF